jgi:hypothetical protein
MKSLYHLPEIFRLLHTENYVLFQGLLEENYRNLADRSGTHQKIHFSINISGIMGRKNGDLPIGAHFLFFSRNTRLGLQDHITPAIETRSNRTDFADATSMQEKIVGIWDFISGVNHNCKVIPEKKFVSTNISKEKRGEYS